MPDLQCVIATPEKKILDQPVDSVVVPLFDGELGILPLRAPLIGRLGAGELRVTVGDRVTRFYIEGGLVEVFGRTVSLVTTHAIPATDLEPDRIQLELQEVSAAQVSGETELERRQEEVRRLRAMLRVARRAVHSTTA